MNDDFKDTYKRIGNIVKTLDVTTAEATPRQPLSNGLGYTFAFPKQVTITFLHENGESVWQSLGELPTEMKLCSVEEFANGYK